MYRCSKCNNTVKAVLILDEYDNDIYKVCGECGRKLQKPEAVCNLCNKDLLSGDSAFEVSDRLYCTDCVTSVTV